MVGTCTRCSRSFVALTQLSDGRKLCGDCLRFAAETSVLADDVAAGFFFMLRQALLVGGGVALGWLIWG